MTTEVVKSHLVVAQNASGRNMNVPIYRMKGARPGPTVYIQSSIHGAEVQGNVVIYHLIQRLKIASVPICAIYRVESTERIFSGLDIGANWVAVGNQYNLATYIHIF